MNKGGEGVRKFASSSEMLDIHICGTQGAAAGQLSKRYSMSCDIDLGGKHLLVPLRHSCSTHDDMDAFPSAQMVWTAVVRKICLLLLTTWITARENMKKEVNNHPSLYFSCSFWPQKYPLNINVVCVRSVKLWAHILHLQNHEENVSLLLCGAGKPAQCPLCTFLIRNPPSHNLFARDMIREWVEGVGIRPRTSTAIKVDGRGAQKIVRLFFVLVHYVSSTSDWSQKY
ncbi:hypothetical protein EDD85DRAFT_792546 [Armillaria nabsnona]|nr:hypothetical protein EDD85DRAFT_792546 [Armillaria nabsnona]